jgi:hypothetical protein
MISAAQRPISHTRQGIPSQPGPGRHSMRTPDNRPAVTMADRPAMLAPRQGSTTVALARVERDARARAARSAQTIRAVQQGCERARQVLAEHRSRP